MTAKAQSRLVSIIKGSIMSTRPTEWFETVTGRASYGKRQLDFPSADGYLSFWMEQQGTRLTGIQTVGISQTI